MCYFWVIVGLLLGYFGVIFGFILGLFWIYFEVTLGLFWGYFGVQNYRGVKVLEGSHFFGGTRVKFSVVQMLGLKNFGGIKI